MDESSMSSPTVLVSDGKPAQLENDNVKSVPRDASEQQSMMMIKNNDETMREEDSITAAAAAETKEAVAATNKTKREISVVGGTIDQPAFCLLDGVQEEEEGDDENNKTFVRKTLPIQKLPAVLGRGHNNPDEDKWNFVNMGRAKALSRQHVRIEYRVATASGGCGQLHNSKVKKNGKDGDDDDDFYFDTEEPLKVTEIIKSGDNEVLPRTGFYVITCLGKNRIIVNGKRIEQGQTAYIKSGDAIRVSTFCLYFLTPTTTTDDGYPKTMQVRNDVPGSPHQKKKRRITSSFLTDKVSSAIPSVAGSGLSSGRTTTTANSGSSAISKQQRNRNMQTEIDGTSTKQLLRQMSNAMANKIWDRRHQLIGSTISQRAVVAAARDLQQTKGDDDNDDETNNSSSSRNELSRGEIMDWIADSDRFGEWVEQMLTKMEAKSYQASITKALIKADFKRTASTGRYIKWIVPPDLGGEEDDDDDSDSDDDGGGGGSDDEEEVDDDDDDDENSEKGPKMDEGAREEEENDVVECDDAEKEGSAKPTENHAATENHADGEHKSWEENAVAEYSNADA